MMDVHHDQWNNIKNGNVTYYKQQIKQYLAYPHHTRCPSEYQYQFPSKIYGYILILNLNDKKQFHAYNHSAKQIQPITTFTPTVIDLTQTQSTPINSYRVNNTQMQHQINEHELKLIRFRGQINETTI